MIDISIENVDRQDNIEKLYDTILNGEKEFNISVIYNNTHFVFMKNSNDEYIKITNSDFITNTKGGYKARGKVLAFDIEFLNRHTSKQDAIKWFIGYLDRVLNNRILYKKPFLFKLIK